MSEKNIFKESRSKKKKTNEEKSSHERTEKRNHKNKRENEKIIPGSRRESFEMNDDIFWA